MLLLVISAACSGGDDDDAGSDSGSGSGRDSPGRVELRPESDTAGTLISAERAQGGPANAQAWRIRYRSTGVDGSLVEVTGFVLAPSGEPPPGGRPVLSWAHGTTGVADVCAPSRFLLGLVPYADDLLRAGYVIVATDYEGLGAPGVHPYLVGSSEGKSVLDAARAALELEEAGANGPLVVFGHSQGGHAALFAGLEAEEYAPELPLAGVVAGAPVTDLFEQRDRLLPQYKGFSAMTSWVWSEVYDELSLSDVLTPSAIEKVSDLADRVCAGEIVGAFAGTPMEEVVVGDVRTLPDWNRRLRENSAGQPDPRLPLLVVQGLDDNLVPAAITSSWVDRICAGDDASLTFLQYEGADHGSVIERARGDVLDWIAGRVSGGVVEEPEGCVTRSAS